MGRGSFMNKNAMISLLILLAAAPLFSADQGCQPGTSVGCTSSDASPVPPPAWEAELKKVRDAQEACQKEIDQFCEGVQVGEGRIEACLKKHKSKLSKNCRKAI
jgi:hypothetical protein